MGVLVSINCITYNHENYISDAIESFLMQRTDFDFEILIGEDCSTDQTRKIVEGYVQLYPNKIKLITSEQNVGAMKNSLRLHERSKGKYIALCEGDDYWTDPYKLQKQVKYMEKNPECTLCFHNGKVVNPDNSQAGRVVIPWMKNNEKYFSGRDSKYSAGELALLGYIPTASFLYPKYLLDNLPEWCFHAVVGDNVIKLITTRHGYAFYMNEIMCAYRFGVSGSATTNWVTDYQTKEKQLLHCKGFIDLFDNFNEYSNYLYDREIDLVKRIFEFQTMIIKREWKILKSNRYKENFRELSLKAKIIIFFQCHFPKLYIRLIKIKAYARRI